MDYIYKIKLLHIRLPKIGAYTNSYDSKAKQMYYLIENDELIKNMMIQ